MNNFFKKIIDKPVKAIKLAFYWLVKIEGDPRSIALGFALGIFIGMTPTMGFQMPIAVFFAIPFGLNKISSAAGVWITNPVSAPIIYPINYLVGVKLFSIDISGEMFVDLSLKSLKSLLLETPDIFLAATLGGIVLGTPIAIAGYYIVYAGVKKYQRRTRKKKFSPPESQD